VNNNNKKCAFVRNVEGKNGSSNKRNTYVQVMIVAALMWRCRLVFAEAEVTATTAATAAITACCDATNQKECLKNGEKIR